MKWLICLFNKQRFFATVRYSSVCIFYRPTSTPLLLARTKNYLYSHIYTKSTNDLLFAQPDIYIFMEKRKKEQKKVWRRKGRKVESGWVCNVKYRNGNLFNSGNMSRDIQITCHWNMLSENRESEFVHEQILMITFYDMFIRITCTNKNPKSTLHLAF